MHYEKWGRPWVVGLEEEALREDVRGKGALLPSLIFPLPHPTPAPSQEGR